jgi:hypothetical protein
MEWSLPERITLSNMLNPGLSYHHDVQNSALINAHYAYWPLRIGPLPLSKYSIHYNSNTPSLIMRAKQE